MEKVRQAKWAYILLSILISLLGVVVIFRPGASILTICWIMGVISILFGATKIVSYFTKDQYGLAFQFDLALGIFAVVIGILLCAHPAGIVSLTQFLIGLFILVDGVFKLQTAIDAKRFGLARWWSILLLALLCVACGLLLVIDPFDSARALMVLLGISMLIDGIQNLVVVLYTVRFYRKKAETDNVVYEE